MIANHLEARIRGGTPSFGALLNFATMFATIPPHPVAPLVRVPTTD